MRGGYHHRTCGGLPASSQDIAADQTVWEKMRRGIESGDTSVGARLCAGRSGYGTSDDGKSGLWRADVYLAMYEKIRALRDKIAEKDRKIDIEVDGGIKASNTKQVLEAGANILVAGSAVFGEDIAANIKEFQELLQVV